jgi:hypothetical protein
MVPPSACDKELTLIIGELTGAVKGLTAQVGKVEEKLDPITTTCQRFEDYREARKNLPKEVSDLNQRVVTCQSNCQNRTEDTESYFKKTDYLMAWSYKIAGVVIAVNIIVGSIVLLVELGIIKPW